MTVTTAPTERDRRSRASAPTGGRASARKARREPSLLGRYLGYVGYFVGAGLVSGAIVHHPLDPARYTVIAAVGAALFLVAALASELQQPGRLTAVRLLNVLGTSLALSFGVGMLSGGMQHFEDFPDRAAVLIPAGLLLSFVAYTLKEARRPVRRILGPLGLAILVLTVAGYAGLRQVAAGMPAESGGHHHGAPADGHSDGEDGHDHQHGQDSAPPSGDPSAAPSVTPAPPGAASQKPAAASASPSVPPHGSPGHHH
ncbi:hypothetical protein GCM10010193_06750 [Kitasatospora atroaurantiaca]|uniref:Uncharacterized protein n=1 Tax=Kitasatospora atroaurantiaca TaxID=285545 RepID=A0A561EJ48_9ACTN|nr:hypothetical protein [Kitasatospora atroaurantiaca]TWE15640.1 hypothetical protein FB465_0562 [Kitasatospora atroaurantiaca]